MRARNQKKQLKIKLTIELKTIFSVLTLLLFSLSTNAQCAMCRASLEGEGNVAKAQAVNDGIVYLMIIPYVLAGFVAIMVYRMYKKKNNS